MTRTVDIAGIVVQVGEDSPPWLACDLEVAGVAETVGMLIAAKRTGRLDVVDARGTRTLFFETGEYTGSMSTHPEDRLGEVLWRSGRLSQDQVLIAAEYVKGGKMLGRALIELGFIEPQSLRRALVDQAIQVFEASCLEDTGHAAFRLDQFHKNPLRFGVATKQLVEGAVLRAREHRDLLRRLGSLDRAIDVVTPVPSGTGLDDKALAFLQLVTSGKKKVQTGRALIEKANLGRMDGARALVTLMDRGFVAMRASVDDEKLKVKRLVSAINLVMAALDEGGFGVGDQVREYLDKPPASYEEALSALSLATPLEESAVLNHAQFITGGYGAMTKALQALLDDACVQAGDTLSADLTKMVLGRIKALGL